MTACPKCGTVNPAEANFCSVCGGGLARVEGEHTASHPIIQIHDDDTPLLIVIRGANSGSRFAIESPTTTIGRHPDSSVFLDDVTVSRRHAEISYDGEHFVIHDAGSLNGTYVNSSRIETHELTEGDQIQVGKYRMVLAFGAHDATD